MDKQTLASIRISTEWAIGVGSMIALIAGMGVLTKTAIVFLVIAGIGGLSLAAFEHGWIHKPVWRAVLVLAVIWFGVVFLGYKTWPPEGVLKITPLISWMPSSIKEGEPLTSAQLNAVALVNGIPVEGYFVYNPAIGATLPRGMQTLSVTVTPNDSLYLPVSKTVAVKVIPIERENVPTHKDPPRFTLTSMSISSTPTALPNDIKTFSSFRLHLQNAGEIASHNLEMQIAMMSRTNGRFPVVTQHSYRVDIEPGQPYDANSDQVVIDKGLTNQVIRIWLRYKNLDNPKKPINQFIYQLWEGNRSGEPSPRFEDIGLTEEEAVKKYFSENVKPLP
jgi:hypothetical protein